MEQKSNVIYRAEKLYKNSREKFACLLREILSNSIHAVLIRQQKEPDFLPKIRLSILFDKDNENCVINLYDNGEGFTENNRIVFEELDKINEEKASLKFHPLGQGRLAILYFSDSAEYETVYKGADGNFKIRKIPYPQNENAEDTLFSFDLFNESDTEAEDSYTRLTINIRRHPTFLRAKTFFNKHSDVKNIKQWIIETFFPFIVNNGQLEITITVDNKTETIRKGNIEAETKTIHFEVALPESEENKKNKFTLWLIKKTGLMQGESNIVCFARNLKAELSAGKLTYSIDSDTKYLFYLTSDYFDEQVDVKGELIEISDDMLSSVNSKINEILDKDFKATIDRNKEHTKRNIDTFKRKYPSLEHFINGKDLLKDKNAISEDDIVKAAIMEKSRIERKFWTHKNDNDKKEDDFNDSEDCMKLLNSSLHIYIKHRERILARLHSLIQSFDPNGNDKPELESSVHDLFFKRGTTLSDSDNINHLHNLWILDDRFTIFSNSFKARSTRQGQSLSDIYIWADAPEKTKQVLILELKSTTKAHNAGNNNEGMVAQLKRYACEFYKNPRKHLNWDVDTNNIQYTGIIIARKSDVNKEMTSNNGSGDFERIPFLANSFYKDEKFSTSGDPKDKRNIRIELYSFEDIYELASSRNEVFFKLLKKEFGAEEISE